jgi:hypothetical protein
MFRRPLKFLACCVAIFAVSVAFSSWGPCGPYLKVSLKNDDVSALLSMLLSISVPVSFIGIFASFVILFVVWIDNKRNAQKPSTPPAPAKVTRTASAHAPEVYGPYYRP